MAFGQVGEKNSGKDCMWYLIPTQDFGFLVSHFIRPGLFPYFFFSKSCVNCHIYLKSCN